MNYPEIQGLQETINAAWAEFSQDVSNLLDQALSISPSIRSDRTSFSVRFSEIRENQFRLSPSFYDPQKQKEAVMYTLFHKSNSLLRFPRQLNKMLKEKRAYCGNELVFLNPSTLGVLETVKLNIHGGI